MNRRLRMRAALFFAFFIMLNGCTQEAEPRPEPESETTTENSFPSTLTDSILIEFRLIRPGTFVMGHNLGLESNRPAHTVTISRPFYFSINEITQAQYELIMRENPSEILGPGLPVTHMTWHDAVEFCERLSRRESTHYSLPTEAEWEYAYRANTTTRFYWGDEFDEEALSRPNPWGLRNMAGGVREWCLDWYAPYSAGDQTNPVVGEKIENLKVIRGGYAGNATTPMVFMHYFRDGADPDTSIQENIGFRVVRIAH